MDRTDRIVRVVCVVSVMCVAICLNSTYTISGYVPKQYIYIINVVCIVSDMCVAKYLNTLFDIYLKKYLPRQCSVCF